MTKILRKRTGEFAPSFCCIRELECKLKCFKANRAFLGFRAHIYVALKLELRDALTRAKGAREDMAHAKTGSSSTSKCTGPCDCGKVIEICAQHISEKLRIMRVWSPDLIP
jgi:hypothetical protein